MAGAAAPLFIFLVVAGPVWAQISGLATVTDGDTLRIGTRPVRLHGIDAPESKQTSLAGGQRWCSSSAPSPPTRSGDNMRAVVEGIKAIEREEMLAGPAVSADGASNTLH